MQTHQNSQKSPTAILRWARKIGLGPKSSFAIALLSFAAGLATYGSLTGDDIRITRLLVIADLILIGIMALIIAQRLTRMWRRQKIGKAGSNMHRRVVRLFMLIAVAPALMVAIFSALFFNIYFQRHFSEPVNVAVSESMAVADRYIKEHIQNIRADILGMAADISRIPTRMLQNREVFNQFLTDQVASRNLSEAIIVNGNREIIAQSNLSFAVEFDQIPTNLFDRATATDVVVVANQNDDRVRALIRLDRLLDGYLFVSRYIDPRVLEHLERTRKATQDYKELKEEGFGIQVQFAVIFVIISLLVVLAAVWFALAISSRLVKPIEGLVNAAERVRDGDLDTKVDEQTAYDEMALLSRSFNRMTGELASQRQELEQTNQELDERRRFTETVLSGVTAGVIGLDTKGIVTLPNRTALKLLNLDSTEIIGRKLIEVAPQFKDLLEEVRERPFRIGQSQIHLQTSAGHHHLLVRIAAQISESGIDGYVVTLDEITELVAAQRMAAWGDIARRIAHEIKNPLTPIQLAAERIKRKYSKQITDDIDTFNKCTDTIIRHVGDIGQMVDEFSSFARMPAPDFQPEVLSSILEEAVFLQKIAHPEINYVIPNDLPQDLCKVDVPQVTRVFTNLLQNAADAIAGRDEDEALNNPGQIEIDVKETESQLIIEIKDNGKGLPVENRNRLTEPYVTHREKGTGLGLAIVSKIMEEHGGSLSLLDRENNPGARVQVAFYKIELKETAGNV
ncbi:sensor histidine kinase NtrY-like [Sneathiella limimaris]|uniref:sensor histidine kinase NtrY-like n=1 Tax=Sneathiella limimaris TaxID=1964213 RepID=UPI00146CBE01|nr:PAS domain-containing sensor histidine kinase [Sneathiella limimaris]